MKARYGYDGYWLHHLLDFFIQLTINGFEFLFFVLNIILKNAFQQLDTNSVLDMNLTYTT